MTDRDAYFGYPVRNRRYAYFSASGSADPTMITNSLGITPDRCYRLGDEWTTPQGHKRKRRQSHWRLDSRLSADADISDHIMGILRQLTPRRDAVLQLQENFKCEIVCVAIDGNFSFVTTLDMQRKATALGLTFWFDIYPDFNPHEEIVELQSRIADLSTTNED